LEVTVNAVEPGASGTFWLAGVTERVGAAWETVTTVGVNPDTVTVMLATLEDDVLFKV
jgi:hypothetical protein